MTIGGNVVIGFGVEVIASVYLYDVQQPGSNGVFGAIKSAPCAADTAPTEFEFTVFVANVLHGTVFNASHAVNALFRIDVLEPAVQLHSGPFYQTDRAHDLCRQRHFNQVFGPF